MPALKSNKAFIFVFHAALAWAAPAPAFAQTPQPFLSLYQELESQLSAFEIRTPKQRPDKLPITAANLPSANCQRGEIILNEGQRVAARRELDALKNLGAQGIVLEICYPLLTPAFRDPQPFLDYYANLANEIRSRGLKLLVEHNSLLPSYSAVDPRPYYHKLTKQRFARERFEELKTILLAVQPDYLTMVSEPGTHTAGLKLTVKDWRTYVARSMESLAQQLGSFPTLLGAGSGLWGDFEYVQAFASIKRLSYIDLHLYPLSSRG